MALKNLRPAPSSVVCDCREEFLAHFAGKPFSTFEAFSKHLQAFEEATGMQYMMKRTCLFNEGTLGREYLIYRYIYYSCVRHIRPSSKVGQRAGGTHCQAYFSVGTRKHKLFVRHYDMQHNHPSHMDPIVEVPPSAPTSDHLSILSSPPPPPNFSPPSSHLETGAVATTTTVQDSTADFLRIFRTLSFASFAELQARMDEFQLATGNRYVKTNTRRLPLDSPCAGTLVYSHLVYICYRYGNQVSEAKQRRLQRTAKIGCRSKVYFYSQDNQLHVRRYDFRHNHEVRPDLVHFPPKRRRTRKEKEEEEAAAASASEKKTSGPAASVVLPMSMMKHEPGTQMDLGAVFGKHGVANLTEKSVDCIGEEDEELVEEDLDDEYDDDDLPHFYLQANRFGYESLLEDDIRPVFAIPEFDLPLQPQQPIEAGSCFSLTSNTYHNYGFGLPQQQLVDASMDTSERCNFELEEEGLLVEAPKHLTPETLDIVLPQRLAMQLQRLGELASSCGPMRFANRLRELKALGDKWIHENEMLIHHRNSFV